MARLIAHVDMDAFFAAIEAKDDPALRGKPLIVGGPLHRGVVSTASYEARRFGVHSAMPMREALRRCPEAVVLPVRMGRYHEVSERVMAALEDFSPLVEPLSLDEAFLDLTGTERLFGPPEQAAQRIKARVLADTGLTCSIGLSATKFVAKVASDLQKPDGVTIVPAGTEAAFLAPLPVRKLWGVGPRTAERLESLRLRSIGAVAAATPGWLAHELGPQGAHLQTLARGEDPREVVPERGRRSVGAEVTLEGDVTGREAVSEVLRAQCQRVARHLRAAGLEARGVRVKLRYSQGFLLCTRDARLPTPADDSDTLARSAEELLDRLDLGAPIRLVGAAAFDLVAPGQAGQLDLFESPRAKRHSQLEHALDAIALRFGDKIKRGSDLG